MAVDRRCPHQRRRLVGGARSFVGRASGGRRYRPFGGRSGGPYRGADDAHGAVRGDRRLLCLCVQTREPARHGDLPRRRGHRRRRPALDCRDRRCDNGVRAGDENLSVGADRGGDRCRCPPRDRGHSAAGAVGLCRHRVRRRLPGRPRPRGAARRPRRTRVYELVPPEAVLLDGDPTPSGHREQFAKIVVDGVTTTGYCTVMARGSLPHRGIS